jgi:hypothetical protein
VELWKKERSKSSTSSSIAYKDKLESGIVNNLLLRESLYRNGTKQKHYIYMNEYEYARLEKER